MQNGRRLPVFVGKQWGPACVLKNVKDQSRRNKYMELITLFTSLYLVDSWVALTRRRPVDFIQMMPALPSISFINVLSKYLSHALQMGSI